MVLDARINANLAWPVGCPHPVICPSCRSYRRNLQHVVFLDSERRRDPGEPCRPQPRITNRVPAVHHSPKRGAWDVPSLLRVRPQLDGRELCTVLPGTIHSAHPGDDYHRSREPDGDMDTNEHERFGECVSLDSQCSGVDVWFWDDFLLSTVGGNHGVHCRWGDWGSYVWRIR